jgi:bifunctional DNA-binding transcriptional regulator/antitoxin component of YhaV-PrlF toxin-antitoxin module
MGNTEKWNLPFTVKMDERNRAQIPKDVAATANLKEGDAVTLVLVGVTRKELAPVSEPEQSTEA